MKKVYYLMSLIILVSNLNSCKEQERTTLANDKSMFTSDIKAYYFMTMDSAIFYLDQMDSAKSREKNQQLFLKSRKWYKRAEPMIMAYDFPNYSTINGPNLLKVEMDDYTDIKRIKPHSYQVLEEVLFDDGPLVQKTLHSSLIFLKARLPFMIKNNMLYNQRDQHHLKMIRDAIVNIATKGITGFDSPMLANSLQEAVYNYESIKEILYIYKVAFSDQSLLEDWNKEIAAAIETLQSYTFDEFDRYRFIKEHTNKQLELVNVTADDWGIKLNTSRELNPRATNLFDKDFFNISMFTPRGAPAITPERVALGKRLFNDPELSKTGRMSCGTCHQADKAFTDGFKKAIGNDGQVLQRNTPTLPYAVYQKKFFYDGTADGLDGQIVKVVNNTNEFHLDLNTLEAKVKANNQYKKSFDTLYNGKITDRNIRNAITTYIRSLTPFNSKFDRNMQGKEETLSPQEVVGFNLFMGKAACATCHFPPAFYGTIPPRYDETEFENLGVPANASFTNPGLDEDPGQYYPYKVEERRNFFKTSTVRNIEKTAPYMHNGVYNTLEEVMDFYNVGGGVGMGLDVPYQTLPSDSLNLTKEETKAIIAFMKTLSDKPEEY